MNKFYYLVIAIIIIPNMAFSQGWQWGKLGGSAATNARHRDYNNVIQIESDLNNNIYLLCRVGSLGLQVDGTPLLAYSKSGIGATSDILLTSFTSDGQYRWSKVIGGSETDLGHSLVVDSSGAVYVSGVMFNPTQSSSNTAVHFDSDTTLPSSGGSGIHQKIMFLAKYDTTGNFKWLRTPEPDTVSLASFYANNSFPYRMDVGKDGSIYWFCHLETGQFTWPNNTQVTQQGEYVLRYSPQGVMTNRIKLDIEIDLGLAYFGLENLHFKRDNNSGRFYAGGIKEGNETLLIGGDTIASRMHIACFDSAGAVIWKKASTDVSLFGTNNSIRGMVLDDQANVYITGMMSNLSEFAGFTFNSSYPSGPYILKINPSGNMVWGKSAVVNANSTSYGIFRSANEVAISGYTGSMYWQGPNDYDTIVGIPNQGYNAFIARFDLQSGDLIDMNSTKTNFGGSAFGYSIGADHEGSYYVGGNFDQLVFTGADTLSKVGTQRNFFVAKYACGPLKCSFTFSEDSALYTFKHIGTSNDSVVWDFGDGSATIKGDSVQHTFYSKGSFYVCATSYDGCGDTTFCDTIEVTSINLNELTAMGKIDIYPNPAKDQFRITLSTENELNLDYLLEIYSMAGTLIYQKNLYDLKTQELDIKDFEDGLFLVILRHQKEIVHHQKLMIVN